MEGVDLFGHAGCWVGAEGQRGSGLMGIEIEEVRFLYANEVV